MRKLLMAVTCALGALIVPTFVASAAPAPHIITAVPTANSGDMNGGYILYSNGKVMAIGGAPFYGDAVSAGLNDFVAIAQDGGSDGYWLVTATGKVYTYGSDPVQECGPGNKVVVPHIVGPIVGTTFLSAAQQNDSNVSTGFDMVNGHGEVFPYLCEVSF